MQYSTFDCSFWQLFKKSFKKRSSTNFFRFFKWYYNRLNENEKVTLQQFKHEIFIANTAYVYYFEKITHYYLEPGIYDFCANSIKEFHPSYFKFFPEQPPVKISKLDLNGENLISEGGAFAIHFPKSENRKSIIVYPRFLSNDNIFTGTNGSNNFGVEFLNNWTEEEKENFKAQPLIKFLFGLSLYMDAFPDAIKEHKIPGIEYPSGKKVYVGKVSVVDEENRNAVSPHYRRGHLRAFYSDRFTHMKGKTIYVKGSFVKGLMFDVCNDA